MPLPRFQWYPDARAFAEQCAKSFIQQREQTYKFASYSKLNMGKRQGLGSEWTVRGHCGDGKTWPIDSAQGQEF